MGLSACGFKSMNKLKQKSYFVQQIDLDGDKRIGYTIKNEILLNSSDGAKETIDIGLVIKKKKRSKRKKYIEQNNQLYGYIKCRFVSNKRNNLKKGGEHIYKIKQL